MLKHEIAQMLLFASTLDYRINNEPDTVEAWSLVLEEEMHGPWAAKYVKNHYKRTTAAITPALINEAWHDHRLRLVNKEFEVTEAHCGFMACACMHISPCFKGWIDRDDNTAVSPCPVCRGDLSRLLDEIPPLGFRQEHDYARIRSRGKE